jgi:hypothetical protein
LALDDKYDDIKKLIDTGKEKGYLTYDQVNDLIPHDVHSPEDLDDLLTTIGTQGIDVLEGPKLPSSALDKKFEENEEAGEDVELDLTPGALEKTNDPVRMYLREMGTVPLLTREGEVEIAKRIERGQLRVLKALTYLQQGNAALAVADELLKIRRYPGDAYFWRAVNELQADVRIKPVGCTGMCDQSPLVEVVDAKGRALADCDPLVGDQLKAKVAWKGESSLDPATLKQFQLHFRLRAARNKYMKK